MKIEFSAITRFDQTDISALILELIAAVSGASLFEDLPLDADQLLAEILEDPDKFDLAGEEDHLAEEDFAGRQTAEEKFSIAVSERLNERAKAYGTYYPFVVEAGSPPSLTRKPENELTPASLAAFCLGLFELLQDKTVIQVGGDERATYNQSFEKIFEIISAYAISADTEGVVWWTGKSRDRVSFLRQLRKISSKANSGIARSVDQLEANQVGVNDGGVDALALTTTGGQVAADTMCFLVGATYQRSNRRHKIVGEPELTRLRNFFLHVPNVTFQGVLTIPFVGSPAEANNCRDQNCRYFPKTIIETKFGALAANGIHPQTRSYRKMLDKQMLIKAQPALQNISVVVLGNEIAMPVVNILSEVA